jgi:hypothetical protein
MNISIPFTILALADRPFAALVAARVGQIQALQGPPPVVGGDEFEHCDSDVLARGPDPRPVLRHQSERTPGTHHHIHHRFRNRVECNDKCESGCNLCSDGRLLGCSRCVRFRRSGQCQVSVGSVVRR